MDSALRPREIQARIRGGESVEDVAAAAGVSADQLAVYATPVLAERGHVAMQAMTSSVRRRGETTGHRTLRTIVNERLGALGIDPESVDWDAWKDEAKRWSVRAEYVLDEGPRAAEFSYDLAGRFCVATNDDARWLLGELSSATQGRVSADPDGEPTVDLDDEFALVRATQHQQRAERANQCAASPTPTEPEPAEPGEPTSSLSPVDDVYDVLPAPESELDVLYEMLGGFNEDSVNIYAGLSDPVAEEPVETAEVAPEPEAQPDAAQTLAGRVSRRRRRGRKAAEPAADASADSGHSPDSATSAGSTDSATSAGSTDSGDSGAEREPTEAEPSAAGPAPSAVEPEQPSLIEGAEDSAPAGPPKKKKQRASVPSWDEIMFGGPKL